MVNCLRNADCWKVSPLSGTWCDLCFVNMGASHMEPRKLGKPIDYSPGMCTGNLNSQNALHVESAKQLFTTIFIPVVEHTPTLRHSFFLFLFSLFIYHSFHIWPNWFSTVCILQFVVNEVASMAAILITFVTVIFFFQKKKIPGYKESLFVLNHLIHIFSIYMYYIYIYMITLFWRGRSVRLIRLEKRSLSVGKNFGLAKTLFHVVDDFIPENTS